MSAPAAMLGLSFQSAINGIILICAGTDYLKPFWDLKPLQCHDTNVHHRFIDKTLHVFNMGQLNIEPEIPDPSMIRVRTRPVTIFSNLEKSDASSLL